MADDGHAERDALACLENPQRLIGYVNFQTAGIGLEKKRASLDLADFGIDDPVHNECGTYVRLRSGTWRKGAAHRHNRPDRNRRYLKLQPVTTFRSVQFDARPACVPLLASSESRQKGEARKEVSRVGSYVLWIGKSFPNLSFIVLRPHSEYAPAG